MISFLRGLFPPRVSKDTVDFLVACLAPIDDPRISLAVPQLKAGLLRFWADDPARESHFIRFTYNPSVSGRFEDPMGRYFRIRNIRIMDLTGRKTAVVSIYFSRGLIVGYTLENGTDFKPDLSTVDTAHIRFELLDAPDQKLKDLLGDNLQWLNPSDMFDVELNGQIYHHLRDIGGGDFLAMDSDGQFYEVRHDPFEINQLSDDLRPILDRY